MDKLFKKNKNLIKAQGAFSVAEVMVTIVVVGIIAAFTLPVINIKVQEKVLSSKLKQVYFLLNTSYQSALRKYGSPKYWGMDSGVHDTTTNVATFDGNEFFYSRLLEGLKYEDVRNTLPPQPTNYLNNADRAVVNPDGFERQPLFRLSDGTTFFHSWYSVKGCANYGINACGDFIFDLNGAAEPNVIGIDQFVFFYTPTAIVPVGYASHDLRSAEKVCDVKESVVYNGYGCAAWVIEKGTMPWLRGKQVRWSD